jgi:hypothetical protein
MALFPEIEVNFDVSGSPASHQEMGYVEKLTSTADVSRKDASGMQSLCQDYGDVRQAGEVAVPDSGHTILRQAEQLETVSLGIRGKLYNIHCISCKTNIDLVRYPCH